MEKRNRIAITGCGWITPFACGTIDEILAAATSDRPAPQPSGYWQVPDSFADRFEHLSNEVRRDKTCWLAAAAMTIAARQAELSLDEVPSERLGLVLGCALAGQIGMITFAEDVRAKSPRFVSPIHFPQTVGNYPAGALARALGIRGPNITIARGVASGLTALIEACGFLREDLADVVIAGGVDALDDAVASIFAEGKSHQSEGACLYVLERLASAQARDACPLAILQDQPVQPVSELTASPDIVVSTAGSALPGVVEIESLIGHCHAALGAATVAAGIAALRGIDVPISKDEQVIHSYPREPTTPPTTGRTCVATVPGSNSPSQGPMVRFRLGPS